MPKVAALEFKSYDAYRELVSNVKLAEDGKECAIWAGSVAAVALVIVFLVTIYRRNKTAQPATPAGPSR